MLTSKKLSLKTKKILLSIATFIFVGVIVLIFFVLPLKEAGPNDDTQTDSNSGISRIEESIEGSNNEVQKSLAEYSKEISDNNSKNIENISLVEKLKELELSQQGRVGISIINNLIKENKISEAQQFIDYVMTFETGYGLEASKICYMVADTTERKTKCLEIMTAKAIQQGIIKPNENLPKDYYEMNTQESG